MYTTWCISVKLMTEIQCLINDAGKFVITYIDDILIYCTNMSPMSKRCYPGYSRISSRIYYHSITPNSPAEEATQETEVESLSEPSI